MEQVEELSSNTSAPARSKPGLNHGPGPMGWSETWGWREGRKLIAVADDSDLGSQIISQCRYNRQFISCEFNSNHISLSYPARACLEADRKVRSVATR